MLSNQTKGSMLSATKSEEVCIIAILTRSFQDNITQANSESESVLVERSQEKNRFHTYLASPMFIRVLRSNSDIQQNFTIRISSRSPESG